jgi:hypothetical protein
MEIKVSVGELLDKITILEIKKNKIQDPLKLANVTKEYSYLLQKLNELDIIGRGSFNRYYNDLLEVNMELWDIEDGKRNCERTQDFGEHFVQLARQVYLKNDLRASIKKQINTNYGSEIVEEKSYTKYD